MPGARFDSRLRWSLSFSCYGKGLELGSGAKRHRIAGAGLQAGFGNRVRMRESGRKFDLIRRRVELQTELCTARIKFGAGAKQAIGFHVREGLLFGTICKVRQSAVFSSFISQVTRQARKHAGSIFIYPESGYEKRASFKHNSQKGHFPPFGIGRGVGLAFLLPEGASGVCDVRMSGARLGLAKVRRISHRP